MSLWILDGVVHVGVGDWGVDLSEESRVAAASAAATAATATTATTTHLLGRGSGLGSLGGPHGLLHLTALHLAESTEHLAGLLAHAATATAHIGRGQQDGASPEGEGSGGRSGGSNNSGRHLFVLNIHTIYHG